MQWSQVILRLNQEAKDIIGPLGWQKVIKQDNGGRWRKKGEQVSLIKKAAKTHLIVATLIATVTFAAGFTLPSVYDDQKKGEDQGLTVLAPPPDGSKDRMGWDPSSDLGFFFFVITDMVALFLSSLAVLAYFLMALCHNVEVVRKLINMGYLFTYSALVLGSNAVDILVRHNLWIFTLAITMAFLVRHVLWLFK